MKKATNYPKEQVPESYSRELDAFVSEQEMPYGYSTMPDLSPHGDMRSRQDKDMYRSRGK